MMLCLLKNITQKNQLCCLYSTSHFFGIELENGYTFNGWSSLREPLLKSREDPILFNNIVYAACTKKNNKHSLISPYMLRQVKLASVRRQKLETLQKRLLRSKPRRVYYKLSRTPFYDGPKFKKSDTDLFRFRISGDRLTYVIHYQTFFSMVFKHLKAIHSINYYWKYLDSFKTANSRSRSIWLGNIWYGNKPLYIFQPVSKLGPLSNVFQYFVRLMWFLWTYDDSKNIDTTTRTWKVYFFLRKAWQLEVKSKRRLSGVCMDRRVYLRKVKKRYSVSAKALTKKEFRLLQSHVDRLSSKNLSTALTNYRKLVSQFDILSYLPVSKKALGNMDFLVVSYFSKHLAVYSNYIRFFNIINYVGRYTNIKLFNRLIFNTLYLDFNFDRPREPQWKNCFLYPSYKFLGKNIPRIRRRFIPRSRDLFWIHTWYPKGRSPLNLFSVNKRLKKHSFSFRVHQIHHTKSYPLTRNPLFTNPKLFLKANNLLALNS